MRLVDTVNKYRIYTLDLDEAIYFDRAYPCFVCWHPSNDDQIGNMSLTENESGNLAAMVHWCEEN